MNDTNTINLPVRQQTAGELAATAAAALAKATIEAKFAIANHPLSRRNRMSARADILEACKSQAFAKGALYTKTVGGKPITGLSIRFAETAIQCWRNVDVSAPIVFEDDSRRMVRVTVTDLETNLSYSDDVLLDKTVERRFADKGRQIIAERKNTNGETVFIVRATEDELYNKLQSAKSRAIRNSGLRLIPQDILEEAREAIEKTIDGIGGGDPRKQVKDIADAFTALGIKPGELEKYLGHNLETVTPAEIRNLRGVYQAIKDGEAAWTDYVAAEPVKPAKAAPFAATRAEAQPHPAEQPKPEQQVAPAPAPTPAPSPAPKPASAPAPAQASPEPKSPQEMLAEIVTGAGHDFATWAQWAFESSLIEDPSSIPSFDDVPVSLCNKLVRSKNVMLKAMSGPTKH